MQDCGCVIGITVATLGNVLIQIYNRAGGIICEENLNFFIQFVAYTAFYCVFVSVIIAILLPELVKVCSPSHSANRLDFYHPPGPCLGPKNCSLIIVWREGTLFERHSCIRLHAVPHSIPRFRGYQISFAGGDADVQHREASSMRTLWSR
jgi:hypothetical protein